MTSEIADENAAAAGVEVGALRMEVAFGVFRDLPKEFAGMKMRELTAGSFALLERRENGLLFGKGEEDLSAQEMMGAVAEYVWIHTAPLEEVLDADEAGEKAWVRAVRKFGMEKVTLEAAAAFLDGFGEGVARLAAVQVRPLETDEDEDDDAGKIAPCPTGSPATRRHSEGTKELEERDGFYGSSPTREGSPTFTRSPQPTEQATSGPTGGKEIPRSAEEPAGNASERSRQSGEREMGRPPFCRNCGAEAMLTDLGVCTRCLVNKETEEGA